MEVTNRWRRESPTPETEWIARHALRTMAGLEDLECPVLAFAGTSTFLRYTRASVLEAMRVTGVKRIAFTSDRAGGDNIWVMTALFRSILMSRLSASANCAERSLRRVEARSRRAFGLRNIDHLQQSFFVHTVEEVAGSDGRGAKRSLEAQLP